MKAAELARCAAELGLDVVGALRPRRTRGPSGTSATPRRGSLRRHEVHDGPARGLVPPRAPARRRGAYGRLGGPVLLGRRARNPEQARAACRGTPGAITTRSCATGSTSSAGSSVAATACSWTRTSTSIARAPAPGVGFYGKNTMLITREHGSWVVLGRSSPTSRSSDGAARLDCGRCRLCIDACPTGALDEPGVLDANRCLSYWTQAPEPVPEEYREELGSSVYGCDICQDVCPWNRGSRSGAPDLPLPGRRRAERLAPRMADRRRGRARRELDRLYVPRNDPRWLRRNALYALGNTGTATPLPIRRRVGRERRSASSPMRPPGPARRSRSGGRAATSRAGWPCSRTSCEARSRRSGRSPRPTRRRTRVRGGGCSSSPARRRRASSGCSPTPLRHRSRSSASTPAGSRAMSARQQRSEWRIVSETKTGLGVDGDRDATTAGAREPDRERRGSFASRTAR